MGSQLVNREHSLIENFLQLFLGLHHLSYSALLYLQAFIIPALSLQHTILVSLIIIELTSKDGGCYLKVNMARY